MKFNRVGSRSVTVEDRGLSNLPNNKPESAAQSRVKASGSAIFLIINYAAFKLDLKVIYHYTLGTKLRKVKRKIHNSISQTVRRQMLNFERIDEAGRFPTFAAMKS